MAKAFARQIGNLGDERGGCLVIGRLQAQLMNGTSEILREVISGVAEMERLKIAERTQRGKRARVESGKYNVGSHAAFGYQWEAPAVKERLIENPATSPIVHRIFRTIANGGSARRIALTLTAEKVPTTKGIGDTWYWSTIRTIVRIRSTAATPVPIRRNAHG